ncbi:unnamed protein product, partial [Protopolystoma xenopodis]
MSVEYAISLTRFAEPIGSWARRYVAQRLDAATDGLHSSLAATPLFGSVLSVPGEEEVLASPQTPVGRTWMEICGLTLDPPIPPPSPALVSVTPALPTSSIASKIPVNGTLTINGPDPSLLPSGKSSCVAFPRASLITSKEVDSSNSSQYFSTTQPRTNTSDSSLIQLPL